MQSSVPPPSSRRARYDEDIVLRFNVTSADEAEALAEATAVLFLDIWGSNDGWVDIRLAKDMVSPLLGLLPSSLQRSHAPLIYDLTRAISQSYPSSVTKDQSSQVSHGGHAFTHDLRTSIGTTENPFFSDYQPLSVIVPWMKLLGALFPSHVTIFSIGLSSEGREIPAFRLGVHPTNRQEPDTPRKTVIISGGSHAREWISVSTVNYMAYSLITTYGKSQMVTKLLERFDWVFIPTLNVDGYVYTWEHDRLWRKNRQDTSLSFCRGIDLDRNFGFHWDGSLKGNPCSESFPGESAFQAVESRRLADWAKNETDNNNVAFVGFLDFHSYSQQILYPYSYSCGNIPPSLENLEELAIGLAKAIRISTGEQYGITSACEGTVSLQNGKRSVHPRMETGGGSALDWFYHEMGVRYAYQIKLRDTGSYGFLLPKENIIPTGEEAFHAIEYFGRFLESGIPFTDDEIPAVEVNRSAQDEAKRVLPDHQQMPEPTAATKVSSNDGESTGLAGREGDVGSTNWELKRRRRRRR
ncbi:putative metallocarboxypeptidase ecm14 [Trichoglossum hirsutum]|uniref:Inactive metallocarboxypeptidase ECM14 n=1 Tax=Trichoglossum hirsutum TaxID=265104 RepID=A0A9P8LAG7_9PEZI|nr:putative metallocarboxypeptidase ecm14 [Trichoglossum hirsutum]